MRVRRTVLAGSMLLALATAAQATPAMADSPAKTEAGTAGRFTRYDVSALDGTTVSSTVMDGARTVSALVQIEGAPAVTRQAEAEADGRTLSGAAARKQVRATQTDVVDDLEDAGAEVEGSLTTVLNAVRVTVKSSDLADLEKVDGVKAVQVSSTVQQDNAAAATYTTAATAWDSLGYTGEGQVVGVIDDGIDYTHADFGGEGTEAAYADNDRTTVEDGTFPTAKVVGGYDFVGDEYDAGGSTDAALTPAPDADPIACGEHGTHVAGSVAGAGVLADGTTYAGPYDADSVADQQFAVSPGMAPEAELRAYKVFGCEGSVNDDIIVAAIDRAVADGVDVINMSLGSSFGTADGLDQTAIANATKAGVLVVASAGNSGEGAYIVGGPSTATQALSVAAMDATSPTLPAAAVTGAVTGTVQESNDVSVEGSITAEVVEVGLGCEAADYADAAGKIVVSTRGTCDRIARAQLGDAAGALAVVMVNNAAGYPPTEGAIEGVDIPFLGADPTFGAELVAAAGQQITLTGGATLENPSYTDNASFTSNGPRRGDSAPKPDVAAPGVSIVSAGRGTGTGVVTMSGTSMASPVTAGIAALVRQAHPSWGPLKIKAAIQSTADATKVGDYSAVRSGSGVVQAAAATATKTYAWTTSGLNSLAFGWHEVSGAWSGTKAYKITNTSSKAVTYDLSTDLSSDDLGAKFTLSPSTVTVPAGGTKDVTVKISLSKAAVADLPGAYTSDSGTLVTLDGAVVATPRTARTGVGTLRTTFLAVFKPLSSVGAKLSGSSLAVTNFGTHSGSSTVYQWQITDAAKDTSDVETADIVTGGVTASAYDADGDGTAEDRFITFAVNTAKGTSTQATREYDVAVDTDGDGEVDYFVFLADYGLVTADSPDGTLAAFTATPDGTLVDAWGASGTMNGSVVEFGTLASDLGLTADDGSFTYTLIGANVVSSAPYDYTDDAVFDPFHPALSSGTSTTVDPGATVKVAATVDKTLVKSQTAKGWLVVTPDDGAGTPQGTTVARK